MKLNDDTGLINEQIINKLIPNLFGYLFYLYSTS